MIRETLKGAALAAAVCSMFAAGAARAGDKMEKAGKMEGPVQCAGINTCKGHGSCAGADNSCKGQNSCKGMGWSEAKSEKECLDMGGKVVAQK